MTSEVHDPVRVLHVLTVSPRLSIALLDAVLSSVEATLMEAGATRVWIDRELDALAVMADFPSR